MNHLVGIILLLASIRLYFADADAACSCAEFYEHAVIDGMQCFPSWSPLFYVQTVDQALFLCTSQGESCKSLTWRRLTTAVLMTVSEQRDQAVTGWIEVQIGVPESDRFSCAERGFTNRAVRRPSRLPHAFRPETACAEAICPEASVDMASLPPEWHRYVNQNKLVCNVAACSECQCNAASRQCDCGSLWTGPSCLYYKPEWCCALPETPRQYVPGKPLCTGNSRDPADTRLAGVCGFRNDQTSGLQACVADGSLHARCMRCRPDQMAEDLQFSLPAVTGDRCNVSACGSQGCMHPNANKCLSVCTVQPTLTIPVPSLQWCYKCTADQQCTFAKYECNCQQDWAYLYVGKQCEVSGTDPGFTSTMIDRVDDNLPRVKCQTDPLIRLENAHLRDYGQGTNPYVCAGHGKCIVNELYNNGRCICDTGFLPENRCFNRNPCLAYCNPDLNKATCKIGRTIEEYTCSCRPIWYTPSMSTTPTPAEICSKLGCVGSLVTDTGLVEARIANSGYSCACPKTAEWNTTWVPATTNQGRVGCRVQCAWTDQGECGDASPDRCPLRWLETEMTITYPLTCDCDLAQYIQGQRKPARILNQRTGSCDLFCIHGRDAVPGERSAGCICDAAVDSFGMTNTIWTGTRCDTTRCEHGSEWSHDMKRCNCLKAVAPFNRFVRDQDIWCHDSWCIPPKAWVSQEQACKCPEPLKEDPESETCVADCGRGFWDGQKCDCGHDTNFGGAHCNELLCANGALPLDNNACLCVPNQLIVGGRYCNESKCDPAHTSSFSSTACRCNSWVYSNDTWCRHDYCSVLFPQSGQFDWDKNACTCRPYVYPVQQTVQFASEIKPVTVCGCPAPMQLDPCVTAQDSVMDDRCVLMNAQDKRVYRCICPYGHEFDTISPICEPIACHAEGTVPGPNGGFSYRLIDGFWTCQCFDRWTGSRCDVSEPLVMDHDCGNGTWQIVARSCLCHPHAVPDHDPDIGDYCALDCQNMGIYEFVNKQCVCLPEWTGDLCEMPGSKHQNVTSSADLRQPATWITLFCVLLVVEWSMILAMVGVVSSAPRTAKAQASGKSEFSRLVKQR